MINPDIDNPDIDNPDIDNPDIDNPDIDNAEVYNPDIDNPDIDNPDIDNPDIDNPDIDNPDIDNVRVANPDIDNLGVGNPDIDNPDIDNPDIDNPDIDEPRYRQRRRSATSPGTVSNIGNTTAAFNVNLFLATAGVPSGIMTQLVLYKTYKTPVLDLNGCDLRTETRNVLMFNVNNPTFITSGPVPDQNDPSDKNATIWLAPGELGRVTLRVYDDNKFNNMIVTNARWQPCVDRPALQSGDGGHARRLRRKASTCSILREQPSHLSSPPPAPTCSSSSSRRCSGGRCGDHAGGPRARV